MLKNVALVMAFCLPLAACQSAPTAQPDQKYSPTFLKQNLKRGVTTSEQVRSMFGRPNSTLEGENGPSMWSYTPDRGRNAVIRQAAHFIPVFGASHAAEAATTDKNLTIHFDNNKVSSYSLGNYKPK